MTSPPSSVNTMAELSPVLYADAFERGKPGQVFSSVSGRFDEWQRFTDEIALYMRERAALEDQYIKSLNKMSSKLSFPSSSAPEGWQLLRSTLINETTEMARVHDLWKAKVSQEVEQAVKKSLSSAAWTKYTSQQAVIGSDVREYEQSLDKVQKAQAKGKTSSKLMTAQSQLSAVHTTITQSMPAFLSTAQQLDVAQSAALKEALVRYGTISSDLGRERMEAGERILNAVLAIDDQTLMQEWALKEGRKAGGGQIAGEPLQSNGPPLDSPARPQSQREDSSFRAAPPPASTIPVPSPVLDRKASIQNNSNSSGRKMGGFLSSSNRDRSASIQSGNRYGSLDADARSIDSRSTGAAPQEDAQSIKKKKKRESIMPFGGGLFRKKQQNTAAPSERITEERKGPSSSSQVDAEGYSIKPQGYDRQPWDQSRNLLDDDDDEDATAARAAMPPPVMPEASKSTHVASTPAAAAPALDDSSSTFSPLPPIAPSAPIVTESTEDREAALDRVKSTLLSSKPLPTVASGDGASNNATSSASSLNRRNTRRREVPSKSMSGDSAGGGSFPSSPRMPSSAATMGGVGAGAGAVGFGAGRTSSILSSGSSVQNADPFASSTDEEGVTVTETVNAVLQGGKVSKALISGSIVVARPTSTALRIMNASSIEKKAPNPNFATLASTAGGGIGGDEEVLTLLPAINDKKATVFKYQLKDAWLPLKADAKWSCADGLTRVIVDYEVVPSAGSDERQLEDLTITVPISVPILDHQTKPSAERREDKLVWTVDAKSQPKGRLLASVKTTGLGSARPVAISFTSSATTLKVALDGSETRNETKSGKFVVL